MFSFGGFFGVCVYGVCGVCFLVCGLGGEDRVWGGK